MTSTGSAGEPLPPHALRKLLESARDLAPDAGAAEPRIGRYRILHELGRGGMGIVYAAEDPELKRRVALKVLALPPGASEEARRRFVFEAQASARLNHPNIAAIYEATPEAIAMQWIDGPPLSELPHTDSRRLVRWIADAARAVHAAHEQGIVHRDLKPQNLLVEGERVFVTDFGLAKAMRVEEQVSRSGHVLGTPAYMAPEQARGESHRIDPRTDVWGLGATLFDLLAGHPPFAERDPLVLLRHLAHDEAPRLRSARRDAPRELDVIVARCLQREPAHRYASALELAEDLERWLSGVPIRARAPSLRYRASKLVQRHRAGFALAALTLLAFCVAGALAWKERSARAASDAALEFSNRIEAVLRDAEDLRGHGLEEEACARLDAGLIEAQRFRDRYAVPRAEYLHGRLLASRGRPEEAETCFERALIQEPELVEARFELCCSRARALLADAATTSSWSGIEAEDELQAPLRELRRRLIEDLALVVARSDRLRRADAEYAGALRAWLASDRSSARRGLEAAMRFDPTHREAALAQSRLELAEGRSDVAWALAMQAVDLQRGFGPAYVARALRGDPVERAVRQLALSAAEQRVETGDASPEALRERGTARLRLSDVEGALADLSRAVAEKPDDAAAHAHLGLVHARRAAARSAEENDAALEDWTRSREALDAALLLDPTLSDAWNNRGVAELECARRLERLQRREEAGAARRRAHEDFDAALAREPNALLALLNRAQWKKTRAEEAATSARWADAELYAEEADRDLAAASAAHAGDVDVHLARAELGSLRASISAQRFRASAEGAHDRAIELAPLDPLPRALRGLFHARGGRQDAAREDLEAALRLRPNERWRTLLERELELLR